jgi:hypothetical protein
MTLIAKSLARVKKEDLIPRNETGDRGIGGHGLIGLFCLRPVWFAKFEACGQQFSVTL